MSEPIPLNAPRAPLDFARGVAMGFTHIVPAGLDHILFVLGLFLLSGRTREVLMQVTAFTIAHSVTLGLSLYGLVSAPASIVEPLIALSVAYVGVENLMTRRLHPWRMTVVFAFGLLHGMGFAEALADLRRRPRVLWPRSSRSALAWKRAGSRGHRRGRQCCIREPRSRDWRCAHRAAASAAIGLLGAFWTFNGSSEPGRATTATSVNLVTVASAGGLGLREGDACCLASSACSHTPPGSRSASCGAPPISPSAWLSKPCRSRCSAACGGRLRARSSWGSSSFGRRRCLAFTRGARSPSRVSS